MRELGGLVQEQVLDDHALERRQRRLDMLGVRIRLGDVLALHIHALVVAGNGGIEHVRDAHARIRLDLNAPLVAEQLAYGRIGHVAVTRQFVRE
jgi:hypothetical protein